MQTYRVFHKRGQSKLVTANNLKEAEEKADKVWKDWADIYIVDKTKGEEIY